MPLGRKVISLGSMHVRCDGAHWTNMLVPGLVKWLLFLLHVVIRVEHLDLLLS